MRKKKTLTIFYQVDPLNSTIGGIQTLIHSFIKYAPDEIKLRVVGITSSPEIQLKKWHKISVSGTEVFFMPLLYIEDDNIRSKIPTTLKYTFALLGHHFESDFMHFHRLEPSILSLPWRSKKILFIHNDIHQQMISKDSKNAILWRRFPRLYFAIEGFLVNQFTQILSCNSNSVKLYKQRYSHLKNKVKFVKNSVDDEVFYLSNSKEKNKKRVLLAQKMNLALKTRFVIFAGRLHPQKDPLLLVQSISALNDPYIHLLIAGEGELENAVRSEIIRLGMTQRISMLGKVEPRRLAELHRSSELCILTSIYEGLPLVVLEALSCGTPIPTKNCGETPTILIKGSGLVGDKPAPEAIAEPFKKSSQINKKLGQKYAPKLLKDLKLLK